MKISIIVAAGLNGGIGKENKLLWHLPTDLKNFKALTTGHCIIMGRKTFESIGKPLPNRTTIIITTNPQFKAEGCVVVNSLAAALDVCRAKNETEAFVIGGGEIYKQALPIATHLNYTQVHHTFDSDTFFTFDKADWTVLKTTEYAADEKHAYAFTVVDYERKKD